MQEKVMQEKIIVIADSCCDVGKELQEKYNIRVLPVHVIYPDREYEDGVDIDPKIVYERFPDLIPTTSMPSPGEILDFLTQIRDEGYTHCISINVSDHLSGTVNNVRNISGEVEGLTTYVYNTKDISFGSGVYAVYAAKLVQEGIPFAEICRRLEAKREDSHLMFYMDSLEYLKKGGRIGNVAFMIANVLHMKPIIACDPDGVYYSVAKIRGAKKGKQKLIDEVVAAAGNRKCWLAVLHGDAEEEGEQMIQLLKERIPNGELIYFNQINASLAVNTGPGLIGLLAFVDP